eukprot:scaffold105269_cov23-Cyclotella_meneghiniana.AAC.1
MDKKPPWNSLMLGHTQNTQKHSIKGLPRLLKQRIRTLKLRMRLNTQQVHPNETNSWRTV